MSRVRRLKWNGAVLFGKPKSKWRKPILPHKPEEGSRDWLIEQNDIYFSRYIRNRDGVSVLSGRGGFLHASHFFSRRWLNIRWHEKNVHAMTPEENLRHNFNQTPYLKFMLATYGDGILEELNALRYAMTTPTDEELRATLDYYKART
jgi:hypothetical protein